MRLINKTRNIPLADNCSFADNPFKRMLGLLGRRGFNFGEALILRPANSIHSCFMRFSIDVLFLDRQDRVVALIKNFSPWHISKIYWKARSVVELPAGIIQKTSTVIGDIIIAE